MERRHHIFVNIYAIYYLLVAFLIFKFYLLYRPHEQPVDLISAILIISSLLYLVVSIGILKRKRNIYLLLLLGILIPHICWEIITLFIAMFEYSPSIMKLLGKVCFIVFYIFNVYYFLCPKVKEQFK